MSWLEKWIMEKIDEIKQKGLYRELREVSSPQRSRIIINGREVINFSSNNYLGLASHPEVIKALVNSAEKWGVGSGSARLIVGNHSPHNQLEKYIAEFKEKEASLVYTSGYHTNVGIITALMGKEDEIFSDQLNHASIIDGCRLSKAKISIYRHRDTGHLEELLSKSRAEKKLIVTDTVFSMDGDLAPLKEIVEIAGRYNAAVMVDEAHATGIFGPEGRGLAFHLGLQNEIEIHMGTLGKAVGVSGGYVAGSKNLINFLINRSRSFIFTTGYPVPLASAIIKAMEIMRKDERLRKKLWENIRFFEKRAEELFKREIHLSSQIVPVIIGREETTLKISADLYEKGFFVGAIRPPTVPPGTSRLRVSLMATHTFEEISDLLESLLSLGKKYGITLKIGV